MGGDTGSGSLGFGDQYGPYAGYVHPDEYVIPSFIRSHPYVADVMPAIEAIRQEKVRGFYRGGETSKEKNTGTPKSSSSEGISSAKLERIIQLQEENNELLRKFPKNIRAYMKYTDWKESIDEMEGLEKKYMR
jgi:hypothetical protein